MNYLTQIKKGSIFLINCYECTYQTSGAISVLNQPPYSYVSDYTLNYLAGSPVIYKNVKKLSNTSISRFAFRNFYEYELWNSVEFNKTYQTSGFYTILIRSIKNSSISAKVLVNVSNINNVQTSTLTSTLTSKIAETTTSKSETTLITDLKSYSSLKTEMYSTDSKTTKPPIVTSFTSSPDFTEALISTHKSLSIYDSTQFYSVFTTSKGNLNEESTIQSSYNPNYDSTSQESSTLKILFYCFDKSNIEHE